MIAMEDNAKKNPNKICDIKRSLQDENLVATHSHVRPKPEDWCGCSTYFSFRK
jgi:hypothetical protein